MDISAIGSLAQYSYQALQAGTASPSTQDTNLLQALGSANLSSGSSADTSLATLADRLYSTSAQSGDTASVISAFTASVTNSATASLLASLDSANTESGFSAAVAMDATLAIQSYTNLQNGIGSTALSGAEQAVAGEDTAQASAIQNALQNAYTTSLGSMMSLLA